MRPNPSARTCSLALAAVGLMAGAAACGGGDNSGSASGGKSISLVAYSTPREAYEAIIPKFQATTAGKGVEFDQSYGSSGEQSRAVESGLKADVVTFSLAPDMDRLVKANLVSADWSAGPTKGFVTNSVVVFVVRSGNPKHIRTWDDLVKPGVEVLTPNVFTSGGAKWNTMAAYGAQITQGRSSEQAREYLTALYRNVSVQDKSARESLQTFTSGKGDVLLSYENEAILAKKKGQKVDYVVPDQTILIQNPIAVTTSASDAAAAKAFVDFALSAPAQRIFAAEGYRPTDPAVAKETHFPQPKGLFTIGDLGGWSTVNDKFFDRDNGVVAKIFRDQGKSVG